MLPKIGVLVLDNAKFLGGSEGLWSIYESRFKVYQDVTILERIFAITSSLPDHKEMLKYKGFILTGSEYSANDDFPWLKKVKNFIQELLTIQDGPRLFGICFGHQIIAKVVGGTIGRNPIQQDVVKTETIQIEDQLAETDFFRSCYGNRNYFQISEAHGESVLDIPKQYHILGKSETCDIELVLWNKRTISVQGHPEFTKTFMLESIIPLVKRTNRLPCDLIQNGVSSFTDVDSDNNVKFVVHFLLQ